ncbi:MAG: hypothetical protein PHG08_00630 [Bacilli bacterium]|nr:hypothetical protein [Bacilli bacterium]
MKNFALYINDMRKGVTHAGNPNVNTPGLHRKVYQYKIPTLRAGIYQPWRKKFRKNRVYSPHRKMHQITNRIKQEEKISFSFKTFVNECN